ncbi:hypothetical protein D3C77_339820 [compost metagenome]
MEVDEFMELLNHFLQCPFDARGIAGWPQRAVRAYVMCRVQGICFRLQTGLLEQATAVNAAHHIHGRLQRGLAPQVAAQGLPAAVVQGAKISAAACQAIIDDPSAQATVGLPEARFVELHRLLVGPRRGAFESPGTIGFIPFDLVVASLAGDVVSAVPGVLKNTRAIVCRVIHPAS